MQLTVEFDVEEDGRAIAYTDDLPGVMAYGVTRDEALAAVQSLALDVLSADIRDGLRDPRDLLHVDFVVPAVAA